MIMDFALNAEEIKRPSLFWLATEIGRAATELSFSIPFRKYSKKFYKKGDGHPVLVLPGFMATDTSTKPLRKFIDEIGYNAIPWDLGRNRADEENIDLLVWKLEKIYREYEEPISLVGWSLGGVYARQLAKARPEMVRQVMTLGSPFRGISEPNNAAWIYNYINGGKKRVKDVNPLLLEDLPSPAPVPTTAVYTKEDGVVPWKVCVEKEETAIHQNVQVRGSHIGLGFNLTVLKIIANRLQHSEENWEHFRPKNLVEDLLFYPSV